MTPEAERAYRDGRVDATLQHHDEHLAAINGSVERTAKSLAELVDAVHSLRVDFNNAETDRKTQAPIIDMIIEDRQTALRVAEVLAANSQKSAKRWDGWRLKTAWGLGIIISLSAVSNIVMRIAHIL